VKFLSIMIHNKDRFIIFFIVIKFSMTFHNSTQNSMTFQAWKAKKQNSMQWRSQTKMVTEANQFTLLMIGAIRMEWVQWKNGICTNFTEASASVHLILASAVPWLSRLFPGPVRTLIWLQTITNSELTLKDLKNVQSKIRMV